FGIKKTVRGTPPDEPTSGDTETITQPLAVRGSTPPRVPNPFADTTPAPPEQLRTLKSLGAPAARWTGSPAERDPLSASVSSVVATVALPPQETPTTTAPSLMTSPSMTRTADRGRFTPGFRGPLGIAAAVLAVMAVGIGVALVSIVRTPR